MSAAECRYCGSSLEAGALFCGTCGRSAGGGATSSAGSRIPPLVEPPVAERVAPPIVERVAPPPSETVPAPRSGPVPRSEPLLPVPRLEVPGEEAAGATDAGVVTETRGTRFVLQFSTGESVIVRGDGLIGRAPVREPGEPVDQLVALADAGRSVSKTHLAFGQERGRFWVADRYSTNGTVLRPHDAPVQRCEPGRRYLVSRGTRVDIGDQFFVVS